MKKKTYERTTESRSGKYLVQTYYMGREYEPMAYHTYLIGDMNRSSITCFSIPQVRAASKKQARRNHTALEAQY